MPWAALLAGVIKYWYVLVIAGLMFALQAQDKLYERNIKKKVKEIQELTVTIVDLQSNLDLTSAKLTFLGREAEMLKVKLEEAQSQVKTVVEVRYRDRIKEVEKVVVPEECHAADEWAVGWHNGLVELWNSGGSS